MIGGGVRRITIRMKGDGVVVTVRSGSPDGQRTEESGRSWMAEDSVKCQATL